MMRRRGGRVRKESREEGKAWDRKERGEGKGKGEKKKVENGWRMLMIR